VVDEWVLAPQQCSTCRPTTVRSTIWFRFHWVHCHKVFREHYFDVNQDETVRLWNVSADSQNHCEFEQVDEDIFRIKVHWKGDASPWKHEVWFYRSKLNRSQFFGYEYGRPLCVLTEMDV